MPSPPGTTRFGERFFATINAEMIDHEDQHSQTVHAIGGALLPADNSLRRAPEPVVH